MRNLKPADLPISERPLISINEAQALLGNVSHITIYNLIERGEIKAVKILRRRMIDRASIESFIARQSAA